MSIHRYDSTTAAIRCDAGCGAEVRRTVDPYDLGWRAELRLDAGEAGWKVEIRDDRRVDLCEDCR